MPRRSFGQSLRDAWSGWIFCFTTQRNLRIHLIAALLALIVTWWLRLSRLETVQVVLAICLVIMAEMFNTAVEKAVDLCVTTYHPAARAAKDVAAGAVLVAAVNAVVTGLLVFLPHLQDLW